MAVGDGKLWEENMFLNFYLKYELEIYKGNMWKEMQNAALSTSVYPGSMLEANEKLFAKLCV